LEKKKLNLKIKAYNKTALALHLQPLLIDAALIFPVWVFSVMAAAPQGRRNSKR